MGTADLLIIAAEEREFAGILKHCGPKPIDWPAVFACEITLRGRRTVLIANGPGPRLVNQALPDSVFQADGKWSEMISTGFCGALDPALKIGDIVIAGASEILSVDRVAVSAEEKRRLWKETRARIVEMEYAAVAAVAQKMGVPCRAIRVVSDTAAEDLPLDFNLYRDEEGRFQTARIAAAGLIRPFTVLPALMRLNRNTQIAAQKLGAFFANSEF